MFVDIKGFFFFFKQNTAYELRISDWSSDVCSSDLCPGPDSRWRPLRSLVLTSCSDSGCRVPIVQPRRAHTHRLARPCRAPKRLAANHPWAACPRSEERRVVEEGVSTCRYRWSPIHL